MYKTAMRVMMIGLVAMLGVEAEAHWIIVRGKCYWHSGECVRQDKEVPDPPIPDPAVTAPPEAELVARPTQVEILCPGGNVEVINLSNVTLASRAPIVQGDITERRDPKGNFISRNLEVQRIVSDGLFLENPADFSFCSGLSPEDVIIRAMSVEMNLYCFDGQCSKATPHSAWRAESCTLSDKFNFKNYPKKYPPRGTLFECSGISTCHGEKECAI
ncbi:MAG: hypothetical protein ACREV1_03290 [Gammaproteobacteria bacterium]